MALSDREHAFAQVALKAGLVTEAQVKETERILGILKKAGSDKQLPDVLRDKGILSDAQIAKVNRTVEAAHRVAVCPDCGGRIRLPKDVPEGQVRCPKCLAIVKVEIAAPPPSEPSSPEPEKRTEDAGPTGLHLVCLRKGRIPLVRALKTGATRIGRVSDNDLALEDGAVSKHHAEIVVADAGLTVRDCGSRNGTLVNGERVKDKAIQVGDLIEIGAARLLPLRMALDVSGGFGRTATGGLTAFDVQCKLTCVKGSKTGYVFPLGDAPMTVGSNPSNAIVLASDDAAEFHAHLVRAPGGVRVADLFAPSGIRVNGQPAAVATLKNGDMLAIGQAEFQFEQIGGETEAPEAKPAAVPATKAADDEDTRAFKLTAKARQEMDLRMSGAVSALQDEAKRLEAELGAMGGFRPQAPSGAAQRGAEAAAQFTTSLECVEGPDKGKRFPLLTDSESIVGRLAENRVAIRDPAASRRHARILPRGDGFKIVDLESQNGIEVNGKKVQESPLRPGDTIRIGKTVLVLRLAK